MKVAGFTIVRNALKYDYPVIESISSILPLVDEMVVMVGKSEDETLALVNQIGSPKIRIMESVWDDSLREGGKVLAIETNKALAEISKDADWCFYIQADEVLHEKHIEPLRKAMYEYLEVGKIDGLLFDYLHFYGSYDYIANSPRWYSKEIRVIRNDRKISSWGDAQGFRKDIGGRWEKLRVKKVNAEMFHYGWVKDPRAQQRKQESFHKMWHDDEWVAKHVVEADAYDYGIIDSLIKFEGTHPKIMQERVSHRKWEFEFDVSKSKMPLKYRLRKWLKERLGISLGEYKNYKLSN